MKIKVTSDSTCDLPAAVLEEYHISVVPLTVMMAGQAFSDGIDITPDDIYAHVAAGGDLCSTAAVNVAGYEAFFAQELAGFDALIHVNISSDFSSCYQNACLAAESFPNVYVIDSRNLSTGHGHVVVETCLRAQAGMEPAAIVEEMNELATRVDASFLLCRLDYIVKGGRCSPVAALGANLLQLKPCIEVVDGKMRVGRKYRGSYAKGLVAYVKDRLAAMDELEPDRLFVTYTAVEPETLQLVRDAVQEYGSFREVIESEAGSTIGCHCGPNCLGILYIRKKK